MTLAVTNPRVEIIPHKGSPQRLFLWNESHVSPTFRIYRMEYNLFYKLRQIYKVGRIAIPYESIISFDLLVVILPYSIGKSRGLLPLFSYFCASKLRNECILLEMSTY